MSTSSADESPQDPQQDSLQSELIDAMQRRAREHLAADTRDVGKKLYADWERTKWKQRRYDCYDNEYFRDFYALAKLPWSVRISAAALRTLSAADAQCASLLRLCATAVCVGCGPGSDAIALLAHRVAAEAEAPPSPPSPPPPPPPLVLFLVDRCPGWRRFVAELDDCLRTLRLPASVWFKAASVSDAADAERLLPGGDLALLSFAHSVNADPGLWPQLAARYKLVLVIDIESETLAAALQQANYRPCAIESQSSVSAFYHLHA